MENLVAEEGEYGGNKPIFRGDNSGPHREKKEEGFEKFVKNAAKQGGGDGNRNNKIHPTSTTMISQCYLIFSSATYLL